MANFRWDNFTDEEVISLDGALKSGNWEDVPDNLVLKYDNEYRLSQRPDVGFFEDFGARLGVGYNRAQQGFNVFGQEIGFLSEDTAARWMVENQADINRYTEKTDPYINEFMGSLSGKPWGELLGDVAENPWQTARAAMSVSAESLPISAPMLAGSALAYLTAGSAAPLAWGLSMAMVGGTSYGTEYAHSIIDAMQSSGVNPDDPAEIAAFFSDPEAMKAARERAHGRGVPIAFFDAASAGIAGRVAGPVYRGVSSLGSKVAGNVAGGIAELLPQVAFGAAGEHYAQRATGEDNPSEVFFEGAAELFPGAIESVIGASPAAVEKRRQQAADAAKKQQEAAIRGQIGTLSAAQTAAGNEQMRSMGIVGLDEGQVAPRGVEPVGIDQALSQRNQIFAAGPGASPFATQAAGEPVAGLLPSPSSQPAEMSINPVEAALQKAPDPDQIKQMDVNQLRQAHESLRSLHDSSKPRINPTKVQKLAAILSTGVPLQEVYRPSALQSEKGIPKVKTPQERALDILYPDMPKVEASRKEVLKRMSLLRSEIDVRTKEAPRQAKMPSAPAAQTEPLMGTGIGETAYKLAQDRLLSDGKLDLKGMNETLAASYKSPAARAGAMQSLLRAMVMRGQLRSKSGRVEAAIANGEPVTIDQADLVKGDHVTGKKVNPGPDGKRKFSLRPVMAAAKTNTGVQGWSYKIDGKPTNQVWTKRGEAVAAAQKEMRESGQKGKPTYYRAEPRVALVEEGYNKAGKKVGEAIRETYKPARPDLATKVTDAKYDSIEAARDAAVPVAQGLETATAETTTADQQRVENWQKSRKALARALDRLLRQWGLGDQVATKFFNILPTETGAYAEGMRVGPDSAPIIRLALDVMKFSSTAEQFRYLAGVLSHEVIHALRRLGHFTPAQWATLVKEAGTRQHPEGGSFLQREQVRNQMNLDLAKARGDTTFEGLSQEMIEEEAVANMFRDFALNRKKAQAKTKPAGLFRRMVKFLTTLGGWLKANKFNSAEDIMQRIMQGQIARQTPSNIDVKAHEAVLSGDPVTTVVMSDPDRPPDLSLSLDMRPHPMQERAEAWVKRLEEGYGVNPFNPRESVAVYDLGGGKQGVVVFQLSADRHILKIANTTKDKSINQNEPLVWLDWVRAAPDRMGLGKRFIKELQEKAARDNVNLALEPWEDSPVGLQKLKNFYKELGFRQLSTKYDRAMLWEHSKQAELSMNPINIDTPEFRKWFGDSKMVDQNGKPAVFYHGTSKDADFTGFKRGGRGTFFTSDPDAASSYATDNESRRLVRDDTYGAMPWALKEINTSPRVIPVYLKVENPYTVTDADRSERDTKYNSTDGYKKWERIVTNRVSHKHDGIIWAPGVVSVINPNNIKSIYNRGTWAQSTPRLDYSMNPTEATRFASVGSGFYSPLLKAVYEAKQDKAPAKDWKAILSKMPGVKKIEIEWSGLDDWLDAIEEKGKQGDLFDKSPTQVTREQIVDFISKSKVLIESKVQSGVDAERVSYRVGRDDTDLISEDDPEDRRVIAYLRDDEGVGPDYDGEYDPDTRQYYFPDLYSDDSMSASDIERLADQIVTENLEEIARGEYDIREGDLIGEARWATYSEPGGTNYREILLTVPGLENIGQNAAWNARQVAIGDDVASEKEPFVQDQHFEEENIVVHARVKDRYDGAGEKTLFIEEIQSDLASVWREQDSPEKQARRQELKNKIKSVTREHVKARDTFDKYLDAEVVNSSQKWDVVGKYAADLNRRHATYNRIRMFLFNLSDNGSEIVRDIFGHMSSDDRIDMAEAMEEIRSRLRSNADAMRASETMDSTNTVLYDLRREETALGTDKTVDPETPLTPFPDPLTYSLMAKRLLHIAANGRYDKVAWTPGYMQAERWNKAGQSVAEQVVWKPVEDMVGGEKLVTIRTTGGSPYDFTVASDGKIVITDHPKEDVFIGRSLSDLLGKSVANEIMTKERGSLSGEKITFGTSGYAVAYDQHIPKAVRSIVKKFGGDLTRNDTSVFNKDRPVWSTEITEKVREGARQSQAMYSMNPLDVTDQRNEAFAKIAEYYPDYKSPKERGNKLDPGLKADYAMNPEEKEAYNAIRRDRGRGDQGGSYQALEGAPVGPVGASGPTPALVEVARRYVESHGIPYRRQAVYVREVNPDGTVNREFVDRGRRIADAYEAMEHDPDNPKVKEAYASLIDQTYAQYDALIADGYEFTFFDAETDPYGANPWNAMRDLRENKRMAVYGTYDGYGTDGITKAHIAGNPMLQDTGRRWLDQNGVEHPVTANDMFRAVHDAFGHGLEGAGFRADGEENAWQAHVRLFTGPAIAALTSETRGQNSWLNFGPYGKTNKTAKLESTVFADQKVGLMPEWTWTDGVVPDEEAYNTERDIQPRGAGERGVRPAPLKERFEYSMNPVLPQGFEGIASVASIINAFEVARTEKFRTLEPFQQALQDRIQAEARAAGIDLNNYNDPRVIKYLTDMLTAEVLHEMEGTKENAEGWYDKKVRRALRIGALDHPEILTDQKSRLAYIWALAVTSNGIKVERNFPIADQVYTYFKQHQKMPDFGEGARATPMRNSMQFFNQLWDAFDKERAAKRLNMPTEMAMEKFLTEKTTVKEVEQTLKSLGIDKTISGERKGEMVRGAVVLGPKIGNGFFSNLYGLFDELTIDVWNMRTWGRWTGLLLDPRPENINASRTKIRQLIAELRKDRAAFRELNRMLPVDIRVKTSADILAFSKAMASATTKDKQRSAINAISTAEVRRIGDKLRKAALGHIKDVVGSRNQPTPAERPVMRRVYRDALERVRQVHPNMTMADMQAVVWYPEKLLYLQAESALNNEAEFPVLPDYEEAAKALARSKGFDEAQIENAVKEADREALAATQPGDGLGRGRGQPRSSSLERRDGEPQARFRRRVEESRRTVREAVEAGRTDARSAAAQGVEAALSRLDLSRLSDADIEQRLSQQPSHIKPADRPDYSLIAALPIPEEDQRTMDVMLGRHTPRTMTEQLREDSNRLSHMLFGNVGTETWHEGLIRNLVNKFTRGYWLDRQLLKKLNPGSERQNIADLGPHSAGLLMENSQQLIGRMDHLINRGSFRYDPATGTNIPVEGSEGYFNIIKDVGYQNWRYLQAVRAAMREIKLRAEDRTSWAADLSEADLQRIIDNAPQQIMQGVQRLDRFNRRMLDWAVQTGSITREAADHFAEMSYLPYYRVIEAENETNPGEVLGPTFGENLNNPAGPFRKKLKGGDKTLGDMMENDLRNMQAILSAGLKNIALNQIHEHIDALNDPDTIGYRITNDFEAKNEPYKMVFYKNGEKMTYAVRDYALWVSLAAMKPQQRNAIQKIGSIASDWLRKGITLMPGFMQANLWRGKIMGYAVSNSPISMFSTIGGFYDALNKGHDTVAIELNSGMGGYNYGQDPGNTADVMKSQLRKLDPTRPAWEKSLDYAKGIVRMLQRLGEVTEMSERVAVYRKFLPEGELRAAWEANNVINYHRMGAGGGIIGGAMVGLIPMIPFLNARIQGLYRIFENQRGERVAGYKGVGLPQGVLLRGGVVMAATLALYAWNRDHPDWEDEPVHMKVNYDLIYLGREPGSKVIPLPRAFEVGSLFGALPILFLDHLQRQDGGQQLADGVWNVLTQTLSLSLIPQVLSPAVELLYNKDSFTGMPIEGARERQLLYTDRVNDRTSGPAMWLGKNTGLGLSPIQWDHLVQGYTAGFGVALFTGFDAIMAKMGAIPEKPHNLYGNPQGLGMIWKALGVPRFYRDEFRSKASRSEFYRMTTKANEYAATVKDAAIRGDMEYVQQLIREHPTEIGASKTFNNLQRKMGQITTAIRQVSLNETMSGAEKQRRVESLKKQRDQVLKKMVEIGWKMGL